MAAGYILVGSLLMPAVKRLREARLSLLTLALILAIGLLACGILLKGDSMVLDSMAYKAHNTLPTYFLNAFSGSAAVFLLAIILYRCEAWHSLVLNRSTLLFIGQNTIGIFLLHKNLLYCFADGRTHHLEIRLSVSMEKVILRFRDNCSHFDITERAAHWQEDSEHPETAIGVRMVMRSGGFLRYDSSFSTN